ncbi:MAG: hypothetical protein ABIZ81_01985 [Opitutaceae bacterium]
MKKPITKSSKSPAPATKSAIPAPKPTPAAKPAVSKIKTAIPPSIVVKPVAPTRLVTAITALINVGYGNTLYIRGEGPGLSWEKGVPLDILADDKWSITLPESVRPVIFKFLLNDVSWSAGEDYMVAPGTSISVTPMF